MRHNGKTPSIMKNVALCALIIFCFLSAGYAQLAKPFNLQGKLPLNASGYVYLGYPTVNESWKRDSSLIDKGKFNFTGIIAEPTIARLSYSKSGIEIVLEPSTMNIVIKDDSDLSTLEITGSSLQNELSELTASLQKVEKRWKIVMDTLTAINKRSNAAFQEYKAWVLTPYFQEVEEINHQFINKYPASVTSAHILRVFGRELSTDTLQHFYERFSPSVKQSRYGKDIAKQLSKRKIGIPGTIAPLFSKEDINGKNLSLQNLQGKYVLLDFWGSWCVPCRKGNPHLISLYEKYKNLGFEIVGIAADDNTKDAWRKAVKEDKLPWLQILQGNLSEQYNITYYPTKILIDKKGNIIGRFGEEKEALDSMFTKIFTSEN